MIQVVLVLAAALTALMANRQRRRARLPAHAVIVSPRESTVVARDGAEALDYLLGRGAHGHRGYHPLTVDGASQLVERIARRVGLEGTRLGPHSLRHGFTHEYLESDGARIEDLQILLGHESIAMSLHYAGQAAATARRGARQIQRRRTLAGVRRSE